MKVTPALKKELAQWLEAYWTTYLKGDIETWATFLRDDYRNIGGTKEEIWNSKQEIIDYTNSIMNQMLGTVEIRNQEVELIPYGEYMMVHEFTDIYVKAEGEWTLYGPFRMSSLLEKTDTGWIAIHQHGSYPDMKAMEGEAFSMDAVKAENAKLLAMVKSRTLELEIEAALEKVRAVAMGMKKPEDMLDVCRAISEQLQQFGVEKIRNVQIAIIDENIGQYLCYQYFTPYDKTTIEKTEYLKSPVEHGMVRQMLASRDGYFIGGLSGQELEDFRAHRKEENHFPDPFLDKATELDYCFLSIGEGGLGLTVYQPMAADVLTLFKRFHQVFSLAFQRFRDIQKAEAQAREAQIEVAVERVRAQSMAMHHPDDLDKVNKEILTQLNSLQIQGLSGVTFYLVDQDGWVKAWDFSSPGNIGNQQSYTLQFDFKKYEMMGYPFKIFQQTDLNYLVADYPLEKLERAVYEIEEINPEVATVVKEALAKGILTHQWSACARISDGILGIDLVSPPSEDTKTIVLKIAGAFNQAYQRFLDLQKAEAQAREAQIQLALERVRARTMAMQSSEELAEVSYLLNRQVVELGIPTRGCAFNIYNEHDSTEWFSDLEGTLPPYPTPREYIFKKYYEAGQRGESLLVDEFSGDRIKELYQYFASRNNFENEAIDNHLAKAPEYQINHMAYFKYGYLLFVTLVPAPEAHDVFKRFAKEFEQTYTRFLDIQKAEAQAREAQIENALEKVRSRTMAMQRSDELTDVAVLLFNQVSALGIKTWTTGFNVWSEDNNSYVDYLSLNGEIFGPNTVQTEKVEALKDLSNARKSGVEFAVLYMEGEKIKQLHMAHGGVDEKEYDRMLKDGLLPSHEYEHFVFGAKVSVMFITYEPVPEAHDIFKRLGKVFEQTYTRFLDLQKAEAQAREAQIQLSLERIRAKAMAMQHSDELSDFLTVVFEQFEVLNLSPVNCILSLFDIENNRSTFRMTGKNGATLIAKQEIDLDASPVWKQKLEDWKLGHPNDVDVLYIPFENLPEIAEIFKEILEKLPEGERPLPEDYPNGEYIIDGYCKYGYLGYASSRAPSDEEKEITRRIANEFGNVYQRFLDLQKAEAQAREAKIEAALERIRARAMAMHHSRELRDVLTVLFNQFDILGIKPVQAQLSLFDVENNRFTHRSTGKGGRGNMGEQIIDMDAMDIWKETIDKWKKSEPNSINSLYFPKETLPQLWALFDELSKQLPEAEIITQEDYPDGVYVTEGNFNYGYIGFSHYRKATAEEEEIVIRFATEFGRLYQRFLDLQKAEAQARESQIQLSLERIRAKAMAMQHSDELSDFLTVVFEQFDVLNLDPVYCHLSFLDIENNRLTFRMTGRTGAAVIATQEIDMEATPLWKQNIDDWKSGNPYQVGGMYIPKDSIPEMANIFKEILEKLPEDERPLLEDFPNGQYVVDGYCKYGYLGYSASRPPSDEEKEITRRIANEFGNVYQRFLDLQKAEAQARESQIVAALERVRSKSLAMHHSDELEQVVACVFEMIVGLGIVMDGALLYVFNRESKNINLWLASVLYPNPIFIDLPFEEQMLDNEIIRNLWESTDNRQSLNRVYSGEGKNDYFRYVQRHNRSKFPEIIDLPDWSFSFAAEKNSVLGIDSWSGHTFTESDLTLLRRFAKVFEQAYIRFLDLQKAEAQARESQIQLSLERIRAKAMALQHSDELIDFLTVLFEQFTLLDLKPVFCHLSLLDLENNRMTYRMTGSKGARLFTSGQIDLDISSVWYNKIQELKSGRPREVDVMYFPNEIIPEISSHVKEMLGNPPENELPQLEDFPDGQYVVEGYCKYGYLGFSASSPPSDEAREITRRISNEFGNVYQRFLDLQKAEAQAREAEIEVALEKVRSRSLAMHKSEELKEVVFSVFERLRELQIQTDSTNIVIYHDENEKVEFWTANEMNYATKFTLPMTERFYPIEGVKFRKEQKVFQRHLPFEEKNRFWEELFETPDFRKVPEARKNFLLEKTDCLTQLIAFGKFTGIMLNRYFNTPFSVWEFEITERFAKVFDQAYTRFLDLQKAEAQALEATKRASVDRVRAEIASMRTTSDLERIQPLIWNELKILGVPFIRCGVFIMDQAKQAVQAFLSTPDGKSIAAFRLPYHATEQTRQIVLNWQQKQSFKDHMDEAAFAEFTRNLVEQGAMASTEKYVTENRPTDLYLHFLPFLQGMLYVGNDAPLKDEELQLVQNLAEAFSTAYARYEDFNKLELAKSEVESAMSELKATQAQLIQQEKLVSLGQLTAGIAHEIKNPLNFVNNFSEVSLELLDEVKETRIKSQKTRPRTEEDEIEDEILEDIRANLQRIHEHGSRANGIVTSMLQHSRGGSGKKEPTDLNALVKEYVNLSFHGMRAGKNPIDVEIELDLDKEIKEVPLVREDFTRVIINLCNNAFDAMRSKLDLPSPDSHRGENLAGLEAYHPKLTVSTKSESDHMLISVEDNGPGIPDEIKDKILQPFFTTKKGTEGTGLGLSITHDIVKAHGGSISVESDAKGSIFTIKLPNNS
ncbi:hypothetical protein EF405_08855 [Cyclobacteriaceae bacterium YHN15]|nr:hypothetical protein EF405_08855 [Cyclobacteriaceae bacterium YHN15]